MRRMKSTSNRRAIKFGQFKLDLSEERLFKKDLPVHLENRPLQILAVLLEHPDEVVSREELCAHLWPDGTYVDFDEGLNTAIKKLRYALGDSPDNPIFIETVPRRGYRFIAPVKNDHEVGEPLQSVFPAIVGHSPTPDPVPKSLDMPPGFSRRWAAALIGPGLLVITACWLFYRLAFTPAPRVTQIVRVTTSGHLDPWGGLTSWSTSVFRRAGRRSLEHSADFGIRRREYAFRLVWPEHQDICGLSQSVRCSVCAFHHARLRPSALVDAACRWLAYIRRSDPRRFRDLFS
jgi:DNA-binding winged helix-turn-helix (wHTH) protein